MWIKGISEALLGGRMLKNNGKKRKCSQKQAIISRHYPRKGMKSQLIHILRHADILSKVVIVVLIFP